MDDLQSSEEVCTLALHASAPPRRFARPPRALRARQSRAQKLDRNAARVL